MISEDEFQKALDDCGPLKPADALTVMLLFNMLRSLDSFGVSLDRIAKALDSRS